MALRRRSVADQYDGHYHSMVDDNYTAYENLTALKPRNSDTYKYFHTARNSSGEDSYWEEITTNGGEHRHRSGDAGGRLALGAYDTPSGGGTNGSGEPRVKFAASDGALTLEEM